MTFAQKVLRGITTASAQTFRAIGRSAFKSLPNFLFALMVVGVVFYVAAYAVVAIVAAILAIWLLPYLIALIVLVAQAIIGLFSGGSRPGGNDRLNRPGKARDAVMNVSGEDQP